MNKAFGLIDAQRGFMPAEEGERLGAPGFGELPINDGDVIVPVVNDLLAIAADNHLPVFTTQDWHPKQTAHFSGNPDFSTNWPVHCVADTPGALLHPGIVLPDGTHNFVKGQAPIQDAQHDTSYSAYNATGLRSYEPLRDWLRWRGVKHLYLGGLALDYCVGKTAIDFRKKTGMDVSVIVDATRSVAPESGEHMIETMRELGVRLLTAAEATIEFAEKE